MASGPELPEDEPRGGRRSRTSVSSAAANRPGRTIPDSLKRAGRCVGRCQDGHLLATRRSRRLHASRDNRQTARITQSAANELRLIDLPAAMLSHVHRMHPRRAPAAPKARRVEGAAGGRVRETAKAHCSVERYAPFAWKNQNRPWLATHSSVNSVELKGTIQVRAIRHRPVRAAGK